MEMSEKTALITGGSRGIGLSVAKRLVSEGVNVVITARTTSQLDNAAEQLQSLESGKVLHLPGDVSNENHVEQVVDSSLTEFGSIDILVNNAGIFGHAETTEWTAEKFRDVVEVNLVGTFLMCQKVVPEMKRQHRGYIFNISSYAGVKGLLKSGAYGASKAGVIRLGESLQRELKETNIKVTSICPAYVQTDMASGSGVRADEMIQPEDIAETILYIMRLSKATLVRQVVLERFGQL